VQEERREHNESGVPEKSDCQIQISITAYRRIEMKNKGRQAKRCKMKSKRRPATLLEEHKETDEEIDEPNQVDVKIAGGPLVRRIQIV
jgi:hypothetical protein